MTEQMLLLTYRDLASRLDISVDAARMKAKRAAKSGKWKIIAGNHPSDPVRVEIPERDLPLVAGERAPKRKGERKERTKDVSTDPALVSALASAQDHIKDLTRQLAEEKDRYREAAIADTEKAMTIAHLTERLAQVEEQLAQAQRSWWQRLTGQ